MDEGSNNPAMLFCLQQKVSLSRLRWINALQHMWPSQHEDDCVVKSVGLGTGETDDVATILDRRDG